MKIILAKEASYVNLEEFFGKNANVNQKSVYETGYVVEIENKIEGCFVLDQLETDIYWLKQLYITQSEAGRLPFLLEAILTLAKQQRAKSIYVHSHQPVVDILLEALQFHPQKDKMFEDKYPVSNGSWWAYKVS